MTPEELEGLSLTQLLSKLHEMPAPAPVSLWPQTWGWAVLAAVIIAAMWLLIRTLRARHAAGAYRRAALAELQSCGDDPAQIAAILRRTALAGFPRADVAGLTGANWLAFLDAQFPGSGFADGPGAVLATAPFRPCPPDPALTALARTWITQHRRPA